MFKLRNAFLATTLFALLGSAGAQVDAKYPGVGRTATQKEVAAWDIDVRPDFKGLPAGSGSVALGQDIWEAKCALCHGIFGESGEVFSPLVGGVAPQDITNGRVANLRNADFPWRTTFMKVATVSTIWDYINRATPWTAPKSLTTEEVYAVLAFLLHLNGIVPDSFTLSDANIREVQSRMPNRNGMTTRHALWSGSEFGSYNKPDTHNVACMKKCAPEAKLASFLPEFARNAHGNLVEQNRVVGVQHGATPASPPTPEADASSSADKTGLGLLQKNGCTVCHGVSNKIVGPAFTDVAKMHAGKAEYLAGKIKFGGSGIWGPIPMPAQTVSEVDARTIAAWLASGAGN
jgi:cytochrome c